MSLLRATLFGFAAAAAMSLAAASAAHAGTLVLGRCHMGSCSWYDVIEHDWERAESGNVLLRVRHRFAVVAHKGRGAPQQPRKWSAATDAYAHCSKTRPAMVYRNDDGGWFAHVLAPGHGDGVYGYNTSSTILYFAVCHGLIAKEEAISDAGLAQRFGYPADLVTKVEQIDLAAPQDIAK